MQHMALRQMQAAAGTGNFAVMQAQQQAMAQQAAMQAVASAQRMMQVSQSNGASAANALLTERSKRDRERSEREASMQAEIAKMQKLTRG
jgi:hypothetical protein